MILMTKDIISAMDVNFPRGSPVYRYLGTELNLISEVLERPLKIHIASMLCGV